VADPDPQATIFVVQITGDPVTLCLLTVPRQESRIIRFIRKVAIGNRSYFHEPQTFL